MAIVPIADGDSFSSIRTKLNTLIGLQNATDTVPDQFTFTDQTGIAVSTPVESNEIVVAGIATTTSISITGGEYAIKPSGGAYGAYTSTAGTATVGDTVKVKVTSSADASTAVNCTLTLGGAVSDTFSVTTNPAVDTTPAAFSFTDQTGVTLGAIVESNEITISGINAPASISIVNGAYKIKPSGGAYGSYVSTEGTISNNDSVTVRHTASASPSTAVNTVLTIGGVSDTFTSTTAAASASPETLPGFIAWWDLNPAGDATVTDGLITNWAARSGSIAFSDNAAGAGAPYNATGLLSKPAFVAAGTYNHRMRTPATVALSTDNTATGFAVARALSFSVSNGRLLGYFPSGTTPDYDATACIFFMYTASGLAGYKGGIKGIAPIVANTAFVAVSRFDGTNHTMFINGTAGTPVACTTNFASPGLLSVGDDASFQSPWKGEVGALGVYSGALSDGDIASLTSGLRAEWGI
jgi:hypothetical protein